MPFKSQAQRSYLRANNPDVAKKFEAETNKNAQLPEHVPDDHQMSARLDFYKRMARKKL